MAFLAASKLSIKGTSCMMTSPLVLSCRASFSPAYNTTCDLNILWGWGGGKGGRSREGEGGGPVRSLSKVVLLVALGVKAM